MATGYLRLLLLLSSHASEEVLRHVCHLQGSLCMAVIDGKRYNPDFMPQEPTYGSPTLLIAFHISNVQSND